jgi:hypothetical protein
MQVGCAVMRRNRGELGLDGGLERALGRRGCAGCHVG